MVATKKKYTPKKGDFITLTFDPQTGHEQKGRRPGLVVSEYAFNKATGFALVCPITNTNRQYLFHQKIDATNSKSKITGYVMADQVKSLDFNTRRVVYVKKADKKLTESVTHIIKSALG